MVQPVYKSPDALANKIKKLTKRDLTDLVRTPDKFKSIDDVMGWIDNFKPEDLDFEMTDDDRADIIDDWQLFIDHPDWNW